MNPARTWVLVGALAVLGLADVVAHHTGPADAADLPRIEAVALEEATRLVLDRGDDRVVIERRGEDWYLTTPWEFRADRALVVALLKTLRKGVDMELRVDEGDLEPYGLSGMAAIRVQVEGADGPLADLVVGFNTAGGATFVRFPDDEAVYRAHIGGRHRFERPAAAWRDHMVLGTNPDGVSGLRLVLPDGQLVLQREVELDASDRPQPGPWFEVRGFDIDQARADELASSLATLRASEILSAEHPAGLETPVAQVGVDLVSGASVSLAFGRTADGTFAQRSDGPEVFRVAGSVADRLRAPVRTWEDRTLLTVDRGQVHRLTLDEAGLRTVLERDPADSSWSVLQPANLDVDLREAMAAVRILSDLRAEQVADLTPAEAGFPSGTRITVAVFSGEEATVEVGAAPPDDPSRRYVRTSQLPERVGLVSVRTITALKRAFSQ